MKKNSVCGGITEVTVTGELASMGRVIQDGGEGVGKKGKGRHVGAPLSHGRRCL